MSDTQSETIGSDAKPREDSSLVPAPDSIDAANPSSSWIQNWFANLQLADQNALGKKKGHLLSTKSLDALLAGGSFSFVNGKGDVTFEVTSIDLRKVLIKKQKGAKLLPRLASLMKKSKQLFFTTFNDEESFWDDYLATFMMKRVNIIVTATPRNKADKITGVHPVVVAAGTFTMEKDFIVLHSFAVRDNNVDISKNKVIIGNENDWRGLGLGRFLLHFGYLFHHCCFLNGIVPLLVQTSTTNTVAMNFYNKHGFVKVVNKSDDKLLFHELDWNIEAKKKLLTMWGALRLTDERQKDSEVTTTTLNLLPDGVLQLSSRVTVGDQEKKNKDDDATDTDESEGDKAFKKTTPEDSSKVSAKEGTTEELTEPVVATANKSDDATVPGEQEGTETANNDGVTQNTEDTHPATHSVPPTTPDPEVTATTGASKPKASTASASATDISGTKNAEDSSKPTDPVPTTTPDTEIPTTGVASLPKSTGASAGDSSDEDSIGKKAKQKASRKELSLLRSQILREQEEADNRKPAAKGPPKKRKKQSVAPRHMALRQDKGEPVLEIGGTEDVVNVDSPTKRNQDALQFALRSPLLSHGDKDAIEEWNLITKELQEAEQQLKHKTAAY